MQNLSKRKAKILAFCGMGGLDEVDRFYCPDCAKLLNACLGFLAVLAVLGAPLLFGLQISEVLDWFRGIFE